MFISIPKRNKQMVVFDYNKYNADYYYLHNWYGHRRHRVMVSKDFSENSENGGGMGPRWFMERNRGILKEK